MFSLPAPVSECLNTLRRHGFAAYPVGGCVRDLLLGRAPGDWDITTAAPPETVMELFEKTVPTGIQHGTVTVLLGGQSLEVTTFRADVGYSDGRHPDAVVFGTSLEDDLARRDFTVNAMALGEDGTVIDPFGGQADLENRLIRAVGDPAVRFTEDALRMFRAIRFSAQLEFDIEEQTFAAMFALADRAKYVSGERIKLEVEKTLLSNRPECSALFLTTGLLSVSTPLPEPSPVPPVALPNPPAGLSSSGSPTGPSPFTGTPADLRPAFDGAPPEPGARWRAFCRATGFDITSLPTQRKLRAAVLHPEREAVKALALKASDLMALGFEGPALGKVQEQLARHILAHPEDNTKSALTLLAQGLHGLTANSL